MFFVYSSESSYFVIPENCWILFLRIQLLSIIPVDDGCFVLSYRQPRLKFPTRQQLFSQFYSSNDISSLINKVIYPQTVFFLFPDIICFVISHLTITGDSLKSTLDFISPKVTSVLFFRAEFSWSFYFSINNNCFITSWTRTFLKDSSENGCFYFSTYNGCFLFIHRLRLFLIPTNTMTDFHFFIGTFVILRK